MLDRERVGREAVTIWLRTTSAAKTAITSSGLTKLAQCLRQALQNGDRAFRKGYLCLVVELLIVRDTSGYGDPRRSWRG
jgi:hypothetical protein